MGRPACLIMSHSGTFHQCPQWVGPRHRHPRERRTSAPRPGREPTELGLGVESGADRCQHSRMRNATLSVLLVALMSCSESSHTRDSATSPSRIDVAAYDVAYQVTEGDFRGMYLFVDPRVGATWSEYRDDREAVAKGFSGDDLTPCSRGSIGCYRTRGGQPLLSSLPPTDFLNSRFRYSARPVTYWSWPCNEITATSDRGITTSVVCPVMGLVEFSTPTTGDASSVDRFELRSFNGLFAER